MPINKQHNFKNITGINVVSYQDIIHEYELLKTIRNGLCKNWLQTYMLAFCYKKAWCVLMVNRKQYSVKCDKDKTWVMYVY